MTKPQPQKREVVSLFSGGMGLDIGLEKAGLTTAACIEFDNNCIKTINKNRPQIKTIHTDINKLLKDDPTLVTVKNLLTRPKPFAVVGGPPCQAFSTAGHRKGINDIRGTLIFDFITVVNILQPEFFIMENVKGLLQHRTGTAPDDPLVTTEIVNKFNDCIPKSVALSVPQLTW